MSSPIVWDPSEYVPELGCYLKWLHGSPQQIDKMYSMSAFHFFSQGVYIRHFEYMKYADYLEATVVSIMENSPDWFVRVYIDESILNTINTESPIWLQKLEVLYSYSRVQVICVKMPRYYLPASFNHQGLLPVIFRYLALFDMDVNIMLFRDVDNIWTEQHDYFVNNWIENGIEDIFTFMNQDYKRQQIVDLTPTNVILGDIFYTTILSGLWSIRRNPNNIIPISVWAQMFAYTETYTEFVNKPEYSDYKYYKVRFIYGFDELMLTRVTIPVFINLGFSIYALPIKIYDATYIANLFENRSLRKFLKMLTLPENIPIVENIAINNYWHMTVPNAGLAQYITCIITNIYFNLITKPSAFYKSDIFINALKYRVYPVPLLMGVGLFTFKNYDGYNWYPNTKYKGGSTVVNDFINTNIRLTIGDLTSDSDLSNGGDGNPDDPYHHI